MRKKLISLTVMALSICASVNGQQPRQEQPITVQAIDPYQNMSLEVSRIARAVEALNKNWGTFINTFSTNQGLRLDERQQKLIFALEVLNRLEQSLANAQKLKLDLTDRLSALRLRLASVNDDLLPQSIDRYVALRGTTDAEGLREIRRQALLREQRELTVTVAQVQ